MVATGYTSGDPRKVSRAGDTMSGTLALLGTADLSVQDDVAVGDDVAIGGELVVTGTAELGGKNGLSSLSFAGRLAGSGPPVGDPWSTGDLIIDDAAEWWLCTVGGTPGTWVAAPIIGTISGTVAAGDDPRIVGAVQSTTVDAVGDLLVGSAPDVVVRKGVGIDGQVLTAQSAQADGLLWATLTKADVGLSVVDNTSDIDKPISTATQNALDLKVTGPAASTDTALARFDGVTGNLIKDSPTTTLTDGGELVNRGDVFVRKADASGEFAQRVSGGGLDYDAAGFDWFFSVWSGTGVGLGTQRTYMRAESGTTLMHAIGRWFWATGPFGGSNVLDIDPSVPGIGFYGAAAQAQKTVTGSRGGNAALASLLTALDDLGLIVDSTTP